jgi:hypothetical protein
MAEEKEKELMMVADKNTTDKYSTQEETGKLCFLMVRKIRLIF